MTNPALVAPRWPESARVLRGSQWACLATLALVSSLAGVQPAAARDAPVCRVALPAVCAVAGTPAGAALVVTTVPASSQDDCYRSAQQLAERCGDRGLPPGDVLARFESGPAQTLRRVAGGAPAAAAAGSTAPRELRLPIVYGKDFESEFEQFGYNPRFRPGPVSIGGDGVVRVRSGAFLQWQMPDGKWAFIDLAQAAAQAIEKLPDVADFEWTEGRRFNHSDQSIYADASGRLYTLIQGSQTRLRTSNAVSSRPYLLYSRDAGASWQAMAIAVPDGRATWRATIEHNDGNSDRTDPPPVLLFDQNDRPGQRSAALHLVTAQWQGERLAARPAVQISDRSLLVERHSGGANSMVSTTDRIFLTYPSNQSLPGQRGTPAIFVVFNKRTGKVDSESFIGTGGNASKVDNHNIPGVCLGPDRQVHVLLSGHHEDMQLLSGVHEGSRIQWGRPEGVGETTANSGGYTYGSLNCDRRGRIDITARWAGDLYRFQLVRLQRDGRGHWQEWDGKRHQVIVDPGRRFYGVWWQKVAVDPQGRLYLFYSYYANQLTAGELEALQRRFPFEDWRVVAETNPPRCVKGGERRCWRHPMPGVTRVVVRSDADTRNWSLVD